MAQRSAPRALTLNKLVEALKKDNILNRSVLLIQQSKMPDDIKLSPYKRIWNELSVYEGNVMLRGSRILVSEEYWMDVLKIAHKGHLGLIKTKQLVRERVWFPGIDRLVEEMISKYRACCSTSAR